MPRAWDHGIRAIKWTNEPNHTEDVTEFFATKVAALAEHASQLFEGIRFFEEFLEKDAVESGQKAGVAHAEEFRVLNLRLILGG